MWTKATANGYGRFRANGRVVGAHRFSYELHYGPVPEGLMVLHACDTPLCVNPAHLRAGTALDNMTDRSARGHATGGRKRREMCTEGHEDWYTNPKTGWRYCRPCRAAYMRKWRHVKTPEKLHN